jgi:hypothetical protein
MRKTNTEWHPKVKEALYELVKAGMSCSEIADEINRRFHIWLTRSSVAGKVYRMRQKASDDNFKVGLAAGRKGMKHADRKPIGEGKPTRERWKEWAARNAEALGKDRPPVLKKAAARKRSRQRALDQLNDITMTARVNIWSLAHDSCRWPIWKDDNLLPDAKMYCGEKSEGKGCPYCAAHLAVATNKVAGVYAGRKPNWMTVSWKAA